MIPLEEFKKQIESLQDLISGGIMNASEGEPKIYMLKEKAVNDKHMNAINQRSNGRYITKVNSNGKKVQMSAYSHKDLIEKLYDFYFGKANSTLESLYPLWIDYRRNELGTIEKTLKEYGFMWNAHLKDNEIVRIPLKNLQPKDYVLFFRKITKNRELTRKRFNNLKSVMNGILYYAIEKGIIEHNPLNDINYNQFKFKSEDNETIPYSEHERIRILDYVGENDLYDLGIKLDFHLTLRIGELKGLRFDDIHGDYIHVHRFINDKHEVVDDIKGHASSGKRLLPLTPEAKRLIARIKELNPNSEYLFMEDLEKKKFITTVTFNRRLKKYCGELGIEYRSSHGLRFATASILHNNGVTVPELQKMLGHSTPTMTHEYLKNVNSREETYEKVATIFGQNVMHLCAPHGLLQ